jgi:L-asparaginase
MNIKIISTGGTFNKVYNESNGLFDIDENGLAAREIIALTRDNVECEFEEIIHKDSNFFTDEDRQALASNILESKSENIIIIHGTDTMSVSAKYIDGNVDGLAKRVVFVGSMKPYNVQKDEPIFNLGVAVGFLNGIPAHGIYIAMHGLVMPYANIKKDKRAGVFKKVK